LSAPQGKTLRRAAFLDRDGTVTKSVAYYIIKPSQVELEEGAAEAVRLLHSKGYLVIIITNQAGVARGFLTEDDLAEIHATMEEKLAEQGAEVDAIYYCPHHPEGRVERYAGECDCRKPKTGMLTRAARVFGIDLNASVMIGDSERDVASGKAAGCKTFLVDPGPVTELSLANHRAGSLLEAAQMICEETRT